MSMDPHSGQIKAWVGGPNFKHFKYDMVSKVKDSRVYIQTICIRNSIGIGSCRSLL